MSVSNPERHTRSARERLWPSGSEICLLLVFLLALGGTVQQVVSTFSSEHGIDGAIVPLLLTGGPLASYALFLQVRSSGRPHSAALMHAVAVFFALMSLAVANLGSPLSQALSRREATSVSLIERVPPVAATAPPNFVQATVDPAEEIKREGEPPGIAQAETTTLSDSNVSASSIAPLPSATAAPSYSLYDMLSLIGMIATISLIILGALVPEETKVIERRRDGRRRALSAYDQYAKTLTLFYQNCRNGSARQADAFALHHVADELDTAIEQTSPGERVRQLILDAHERFGVASLLAGRGGQFEQCSADELAALLQRLRTEIEGAYQR